MKERRSCKLFIDGRGLLDRALTRWRRQTVRAGIWRTCNAVEGLQRERSLCCLVLQTFLIPNAAIIRIFRVARPVDKRVEGLPV